MPKLVYFGMQGRAQPMRYLLASVGAQYEDVHLTGEQWGAAKAAATYGEGVQLPVWIEDDGKIKSQSIATLRYLAFKHGYAAKSAEQDCENQWIFDTDLDWQN